MPIVVKQQEVTKPTVTLSANCGAFFVGQTYSYENVQRAKQLLEEGLAKATLPQPTFVIEGLSVDELRWISIALRGSHRYCGKHLYTAIDAALIKANK